ncbi:hypothetical protein CAPTEDRAFT_217217 [Capitella teleta]|uniref:Uncharacterized protein n=1 Tax=Capitella teleta TaxID=283909 RepID=R7U2F7_CAPTE|nr:hypothetical protein CAPTEDRAFT_217217 [Capitella teleta]|eukprot:ELT97821.1 hypothetical protein CAPTEDRAFT_217217 [Capitella teleta]
MNTPRKCGLALRDPTDRVLAQNKQLLELPRRVMKCRFIATSVNEAMVISEEENKRTKAHRPVGTLLSGVTIVDEAEHVKVIVHFIPQMNLVNLTFRSTDPIVAMEGDPLPSIPSGQPLPSAFQPRSRISLQRLFCKAVCHNVPSNDFYVYRHHCLRYFIELHLLRIAVRGNFLPIQSGQEVDYCASLEEVSSVALDNQAALLLDPVAIGADLVCEVFEWQFYERNQRNKAL